MTKNTQKFIGVSLAAMAGALLAACTQGPFDNPPLGDATKQNFAVQIIDPRPAPTALAPDMDGRVAASAIERYKTGAIVPPQPESTESGGSN
ncbi:MAG: hypothetical protein ACREEE_12010 [Dongiaceae bacterium]